MPPASVAAELPDLIRTWEKARLELLDLSRRNSLLNFRPSKARGVEVVGESANEIFNVLVAKGGSMSFLPKPEDDDEEELKDSNLQTSETKDKLNKRLLRTYYDARTHIEERGFNNLLLALSFLHWFDSDDSDIENIAPIVLVPVELTRTSVRERYKLHYTGEDIQVNLSLLEKLSQNFGINFPDLPDNMEGADIDVYLNACRKEITGQERWVIECIR